MNVSIKAAAPCPFCFILPSLDQLAHLQSLRKKIFKKKIQTAFIDLKVPFKNSLGNIEKGHNAASPKAWRDLWI